MKKFFTLLAGLALIAPVAAQSCTAGWNYYIPFTVSNANAVVLTNHQVLLTVNTAALVSAGHMQPDGDDIRFMSSSVCCVEYPYYIDSGMNSVSTKIWVKVPSIPGVGSATFDMYYGNTTATAGSNGEATFSLFEDYSGPNYKFPMACGTTGTATPASGTMTYGWSGHSMWMSDTVFQLTGVYTAEAFVTAQSGNWPSMSFIKTSDLRGYGIMRASSGAGIAETVASQTTFCMSRNWTAAAGASSTTAGIWSITWVATGNVKGYYPGLGPLSEVSGNPTHTKNAPLKLIIGGCETGTGSITLDWVRVRKYAAVTPSSSAGSEVVYTPFPGTGGFLGADQSVCLGQNVVLDASAYGFSSYLWSTGATSSSITVNTGGSYWVQGTSAMSCAMGDTVVVTILTAATPSVSAALNNICLDDADVALTASPSGGTFSGPGVNGSSFDPVSAGIGNHTISYSYTDGSGCVGTGTTTIAVNLCTAVAAQSAANGFSVHPNPNAGVFSLAAATSHGPVTIEVTDVTGRMVYASKQNAWSAGAVVQIDLSREAEGMYFVKVMTAESQTLIPVSVAK